MLKKVLIIFGTRPEAIKMAPLIKAMEQDLAFDLKVCVTAQHRQMLDQVLELFEIVPDYDLNIMKPNQDLFDITTKALSKLKVVLDEVDPDIVLVHGDTLTSTIGALAAFYKQIKIGHIEAGLRTNNIYSPWPEEANRQLTAVLTNYHFTPTKISKQNLLKENKKQENILVCGNTVIDSLFLILNKIKTQKTFKEQIETSLAKQYKLDTNRKFLLVTGHRRENLGEGFENICKAIKEIANKNPNIDIVFPVHYNPSVQNVVKKQLSNISNIYLIEPLSYESFLYLMDKSYFLISDSGGIQEEAPALGKPVLVTRDTTERTEALEVGTILLVGTDKEKILSQAQLLLTDSNQYTKMATTKNPYGDGTTTKQIINFLKENI